MKIAATVSDCFQVSQNEWRDVNITKIFDSSSSIDSIIEWAKTIDKNATLHTIRLSEVVE